VTAYLVWLVARFVFFSEWQGCVEFQTTELNLNVRQVNKVSSSSTHAEVEVVEEESWLWSLLKTLGNILFVLLELAA